MKAVVREKKIPFEIKTSVKETVSAEEAHAAIDALRAAAAAAGLQDMSLQEINQIIAETRKKQ